MRLVSAPDCRMNCNALVAHRSMLESVTVNSNCNRDTALQLYKWNRTRLSMPQEKNAPNIYCPCTSCTHRVFWISVTSPFRFRFPFRFVFRILFPKCLSSFALLLYFLFFGFVFSFRFIDFRLHVFNYCPAGFECCSCLFAIFI